MLEDLGATLDRRGFIARERVLIAEGRARVREVGGQLDVISGDALWVPKYYEDGLIDAWDINELEVAQTLYPISREFPWWTTAEGLYLGYPFGWSPVQIYYDPAHVSPTPDSWEVLRSPAMPRDRSPHRDSRPPRVGQASP